MFVWCYSPYVDIIHRVFKPSYDFIHRVLKPFVRFTSDRNFPNTQESVGLYGIPVARINESSGRISEEGFRNWDGIRF